MGGFFSSLGKAFGGSSNIFGSLTGGIGSLFGGNLADTADPGNLFHMGEADRNAQALAEAQYKLEKENADRNYDEQVRMNNYNIRSQEEAFQYQKDLNALQMEREDNAVARRVADLKASGLSPTLAAGSSASATPVHAGTAPQGVAPQKENPSDVRVREAMFRAEMQKEKMALVMSMVGNIADVSQTFAQKNLIEAKGKQQDIINSYLDEFLAGRNFGQNLDNDMKSMANKFFEDTSPLRVEEFRKNLDVLDKKLEGLGFDNELKHNETLRKVYEDTKRDLENQLLRKNIKLSELRAENVDFDTAIKAYTLTYCVEHNIPLGGLNDWQVIYNIMGEIKKWWTKDDKIPTNSYSNPEDMFNPDNFKDQNGNIDMMKLLQLIGS